MKHSNNIFNQRLKHLPRHQFQKTVDRHGVDHRVRTSQKYSISYDQVLTDFLLSESQGKRGSQVKIFKMSQNERLRPKSQHTANYH